MHALQYTQYGGPEVLSWAAAPEPHVSAQVRCGSRCALRVRTRSKNWKRFTGSMAGGRPMSGTGHLGHDGAGVVDEVSGRA